jgi:hypothetical protein
VLCVQELQRPTQEFLDRLLSEHDRVHDPFSGWTNESNIYWSKAVFEKIEHGAEEVGHVEPERRMFWARFQLKSLKKRFLSLRHISPAACMVTRRKLACRHECGNVKALPRRSPDSFPKANQDFLWGT